MGHLLCASTALGCVSRHGEGKGRWSLFLEVSQPRSLKGTMEGLGQAGLMFKALSALRGPQRWLGGSFRSKEEGEREMGEGGQGGLAPWKRGYRTQLGGGMEYRSEQGREDGPGARRSSQHILHGQWREC